MGKKQDQQWQQYMNALTAAINQANQPSPYETALGDRYKTTQSLLDNKDYRYLPTGVNIDMLSLADANKMRQMVMGNAGTAAKGTDNPYAAQQRTLSDDNFVRDWSGAYEQKIGGLMDQNDALGASLMGVDAQRKSNNVANQATLLQAFLNKPKSNNSWWKGLLSGGLSAAAGLI